MSEEYNAGAAHEQRVKALEDELEQWKEHVAALSDQLRKVELRLRQLEKPKMTNEEALNTFDVLKKADPQLNLPSFAAQHGLNYEALRKARLRRKSKNRDKSQ